jgi:hypothetical protein
LERVLGEVSLGPGGVPLATLEPATLTSLLLVLPGIDELATVRGMGVSAGVKEAVEKAIEEMAADEEPLEELVGGFGFAADLEEQLEAAWEQPTEAGAPETFEEAVEEALHKTPEEVIDDGLESVTLGELLSSLLGQAAHPSALAGAIFAAAEQEELQELLGTALTGEPFAQATVAEGAASVGVTPAELAEKVGKTPAELPESAAMFATPLKNGQALGVFVAAQGLAYALIGTAPPPQEEPEEPHEEPGEEPGNEEEPIESEGGSSGSGTSAGSGNDSGQGSTATAAIAPSPPATAPSPTPRLVAEGAAEVRILAHRIRGSAITLVLRVPGPGRLTLGGNGLRAVHRSVSHAERLSVRLSATRAALASLHDAHRRLTIRVRVSFAPVSGPRSAATSIVKLG